MQYFIREWANGRATLVAEDGYPLQTYSNLNDAVRACIDECLVKPSNIERHRNYLEFSPLDNEAGCLNFIELDRGDGLLH